MTRYAVAERAALASTLAGAGPQAPTLCAGWTGLDLAAHLVMREHRPLAAVGLVVPALARRAERVRRGYLATGLPALTEAFGTPPAWSPGRLGPVDEALNLVEFFVHHEDVLRAGAGWQPRRIDPGYEAALWRRIPLLARVRLARFPATVTVRAPGHGSASAGRGGPAVVVTGAPGELVLLLFGRQSVAQVTVDGPPALTARLLKR